MKIKIPFFSRNTNVVCTTKQVVDIEKKKSLDEMLEDKDNAIAAAMAAAVQPPRSGVFINGYDLRIFRDANDYDEEYWPYFAALGEFGQTIRNILLASRLVSDVDSNDNPPEFPYVGFGLEYFIDGGIDLEVSYKDDTSFNLTIRTKYWTEDFVVSIEGYDSEDPSNTIPTCTVSILNNLDWSDDDIHINNRQLIINALDYFYSQTYPGDFFQNASATTMLDALKAQHEAETE